MPSFKGRVRPTLQLAFIGCAASLSYATAAQATPVGCDAKGLSTTATFTYADAQVAGFSCRVTDKILGQFSSGAQGLDPGAVFTFTQNSGDEHQLTLNQISGLRVSGLVAYSVTVTDPLQYVKRGQTQGFLPLGSTLTSVKTVFMDGMSPSTVSSFNGANSTIGTFSGYGSQYFYVNDSWTVDSTNFLTGYNTKFAQQRYAPGAPGPLPLLGAGAAFGFSRRLRRRVRAVA